MGFEKFTLAAVNSMELGGKENTEICRRSGPGEEWSKSVAQRAGKRGEGEAARDRTGKISW